MKRMQVDEKRIKSGKRWTLGATTLVMALASIVTASRAAPLPGDYLPQGDPMYVNPLRQRLAPQSQGYTIGVAPTAAFTWGNGIPNALADYYTYTPLANADALKLGFPAACGNKTLLPLPPADGTSTADCYVITVKRLNHNFELKSVLDWYVNSYYPQNVSGTPAVPGLPLLPGFSWPTAAGLPPTTPNPGLIDPASIGRVNFSTTNPAVTGIGWVTDTFGYGSGGVGWRPPYIEPTAPIALAGTITGNAPAFFKNFPIGALLGPTINNVPGTTNTATTGIWHFPAPSIKGTSGRPVLVQWLNELPNIDVPGSDPTLDCSALFPGCFPYNRIVTHGHGAHVGPGSDGLAPANYNPDFSLVGDRFTYADTESRAATIAALGSAGPKGTYFYPMTQESATLWYHDHAMGATHLNTNQGMAGFFPITDNNEKCLQGIAVAGICPAPVKILPTGVQELGFALQDRLFDDKGQFYMPDAPIIDANFPTCNKATPASRLATCSPLFMYVKHAANPATLTPAGIHLLPYNAAAVDLTIPENAQAPVLGPSTSLEYFGNMPVVNGVVYGKYDVDRKLYRMRFLGGTDSRTWTLQLNSKVRGAATVSAAPVPFYVIGTEQGFLNNPVSRTQITLMPGERIDVLVDFRQVPAGDNQVILANYAPDGPFQGVDNGAISVIQAVQIPEIMAFDVSATTDALLTTSTAPTTNLRALVPPLTILPGAGGLAAPFTNLSPTNKVRVIALEEIVDVFGRIMPTIDRRGYALPGMPATEIIKLLDVEEWDIVNTTADTHPMHIHQVAFQVVSRTPFDTVGFVTNNTAAVNDLVNNVFLPPTYVATGPAVPPGAFENGWKDTVFTPPGFVTKVRAKFDLIGEYVWHCHILSHEEHDMMRPMKIVNLTANVPSSFTVPAAAQNNRTAAVTIGSPIAQPGVTYKYVIEYTQTNAVPADTWHPVYSTGPTPTIAFPRNGIYQLRVKAVDAGMSPIAVDSVYVTAINTITVAGLMNNNIGVFRNGQWYLDMNANKAWDPAIDVTRNFGMTGDVPITGFWNGGVTTNVGVFRNGQWYLDMNANGAWDPAIDVVHHFGIPGDVPVSGDWNGSGTTKIGVFRNGQWYLDMNANGIWDPATETVHTFGITGDVPVVGDWNGSGTTKIGVFRNGQWYLDMNGNSTWDPATDVIRNFGIAGDIPVVGDWDGTGTSRIGVYRNGTWYLDMNGNGAWDPATDVIVNFGISGDKPVTGKW